MTRPPAAESRKGGNLNNKGIEGQLQRHQVSKHDFLINTHLQVSGVWTFPRRGCGLQPRVAVLGYPGNDGGELPNPKGVAPTPKGLRQPYRRATTQQRIL